VKVLTFFLSIWILVCAGAPCVDRCTDAGHGLAQEEVHVPFNKTHNSPDLCSPFCVCSCCAVMSVLPKSTAFFSKPAAFNAPLNQYICPPVQDVADTFWQPPRCA